MITLVVINYIFFLKLKNQTGNFTATNKWQGKIDWYRSKDNQVSLSPKKEISFPSKSKSRTNWKFLIPTSQSTRLVASLLDEGVAKYRISHSKLTKNTVCQASVCSYESDSSVSSSTAKPSWGVEICTKGTDRLASTCALRCGPSGNKRLFTTLFSNLRDIALMNRSCITSGPSIGSIP